MLILIAESKTMVTEENQVSPDFFSLHQPACEKEADIVIDSLRDMNVAELGARLKLSGLLAAKMQKMIYEFGNKNLGLTAIDAFTGVVFKALDFPSLSEEEKQRCLDQVRIVSSLYGWLRPDDIIKPYRLDFTSPVEIDGKTVSLFSFWKKYVTMNLVKTLQQKDCHEILNLMPGDAAKCIDWKLVKRFARVWKVDFVQLLDGGARKTPNAGRLKTLRGLLLRQILQEGINSVGDLHHVVSDHYLFEGTPVYPDHLQFLC